jgi:hypothetical protein
VRLGNQIALGQGFGFVERFEKRCASLIVRTEP